PPLALGHGPGAASAGRLAAASRPRARLRHAVGAEPAAVAAARVPGAVDEDAGARRAGTAAEPTETVAANRVEKGRGRRAGQEGRRRLGPARAPPIGIA